MTIPNRTQVLEKATQLYMQEQARYPGLGETTPELTELKEAGFLDAAKRELMSSDFRQDPKMVEEVYKEMGYEQKESLNAEKIEALAKQQKENTDKIMARLEAIPDLAKKIEALSQSKNFKDLGEALKPVSETHSTHHAKTQQEEPNFELIPGKGWVNTKDPRYHKEETPQPEQKHETKKEIEQPQEVSKYRCANCGQPMLKGDLVCRFCGAPVAQPKPLFKIPEILKPKQPVGLLDILAGVIVFISWVAASGWILSSFALSWGLIIGLAIFWIVFIIVFRVVVGGILD